MVFDMTQVDEATLTGNRIGIVKRNPKDQIGEDEADKPADTGNSGMIVFYIVFLASAICFFVIIYCFCRLKQQRRDGDDLKHLMNPSRF